MGTDAVDTPAVDPSVTEASVEARPIISALACPECGHVCRDRRHLGVHRRAKHGVVGKTADRNRAYQRPKKKGKPKREPEQTGGVAEAFAGAIHLMQVNAEMVEQCLDGLDRLLTEAKKLRKAYIRNTDRLKKLQVNIADF